MSKNLDELLQEAPTLTFEPFEKEEAQAEAVPAVVKEPEEEELRVVLSPEEQQMVDNFAAQIDLTNTQMVLQYGAGCQKKIADFSETALSTVRTKDMGEVGEMLTDVVAQLRDFEDDEEEKGFLGLFKRGSNKLANMRAKYDKAEVNINKISQALEQHQVVLLKDVAMLDKIY